VRALAPRFGPQSLFYLSSVGGGDGLWRYRDNQVLEIWKGSDGTLVDPVAVSADGMQVAFSLRRDGRVRLHIMNDDGTGLTPLADSVDVRGSASWSPDGKWIVTGGVDAKGQPGLFKVAVGGGDPVRLTAEGALDPVWSPDGTVIVYAGPFVTGALPLRAVRPDGTPVELPPLTLRFGAQGGRHRFLPDGKRLVYLDYQDSEGASRAANFWVLDLAAQRTRRLTDLVDRGYIGAFEITPDGKHIVFDRLRENSDIVLIELAGEVRQNGAGTARR
jgi:Tol biopolymer transport system component